jgi:SOS-response transcriptional repressor LexA
MGALRKISTYDVALVCVAGAARSIDDLPIDEWRTIRAIPGCRPDQIRAARINGDSLIDENICDGDVAIIRLNVTEGDIWPGRLVAVFTPYGLLIKHVYVGLDRRVRLVSANPLYEDIVLDLDQVQVQGVVARVERDV